MRYHGCLNRFVCQRQHGIDLLSYDAALPIGAGPKPGLQGSHTGAPRGAEKRRWRGTGLDAGGAVAGAGRFARAQRRAEGGARTEAVLPVLPAVTITGTPPRLARANCRSALRADGPARARRPAGDARQHGHRRTRRSASPATPPGADRGPAGAYTVGDVLANDASVRSVAASPAASWMPPLRSRGFPVGNGKFRGDVGPGWPGYGVASNYRVSTGYVERVELIKGPTAKRLIGMAPSPGRRRRRHQHRPQAGRRGGPDAGHGRLCRGAVVQLGAAQRSTLSRRLGAGRQFGIRLDGSHRGRGYQPGQPVAQCRGRRAGAGFAGPRSACTRHRISSASGEDQRAVAAPARCPRHRRTRRTGWPAQHPRGALGTPPASATSRCCCAGGVRHQRQAGPGSWTVAVAVPGLPGSLPSRPPSSTRPAMLPCRTRTTSSTLPGPRRGYRPAGPLR
ncbi:hypothetical protein ACU4GD_17605 [Cupriavidus basilensis]